MIQKWYAKQYWYKNGTLINNDTKKMKGATIQKWYLRSAEMVQNGTMSSKKDKNGSYNK